MTGPAAYSPQAEKAMIGAMLYGPLARNLAEKVLAAEDFYIGKNRAMFEAVMALHQVGGHVDPVTAAGWVAEHRGKQALDEIGGLAEFTEYLGDCPSPTQPAGYATTIRDRAGRRALKTALLEGLEAVDDLAVPVSEAADDIAARLERVDIPLDATPPKNVIEFLETDMSYRWLVPGWLEHQDRALITGGEGAGKSVVLRQMAVQMAAGIHPWRPRERPAPIQVLLIDFENSERQVSRKLHRLVENVATHAQQLQLGAAPPLVFDPDLLRVEVHPGLDLLTRSDRRWFTSRVDATRPDIIVTGPVYKMHRGNPNDEAPAAELAAYFDHLRAEYDTALLLETHSPHGDDGGQKRTLRPVGSSLWMRWPDFGYGIRKTDEAGIYDWSAWRPPRDDGRAWPTRVRHGKVWPWENDHAGDYDGEPF